MMLLEYGVATLGLAVTAPQNTSPIHRWMATSLLFFRDTFVRESLRVGFPV